MRLEGLAKTGVGGKVGCITNDKYYKKPSYKVFIDREYVQCML
jgi:hypothetical protein